MHAVCGGAGDDTSGFEMINDDDLDGMADAEGAAADRQPVRRSAPDQPMPVALPTSLGLEPARLSAMRTSLFGDSHPLQVTILLGVGGLQYGASTDVGACCIGTGLHWPSWPHLVW